MSISAIIGDNEALEEKIKEDLEELGERKEEPSKVE